MTRTKVFLSSGNLILFHVKSSRKISIAGFQCHAIQNRSNKNQNRSIDNVQNLENERRYR